MKLKTVQVNIYSYLGSGLTNFVSKIKNTVALVRLLVDRIRNLSNRVRSKIFKMSSFGVNRNRHAKASLVVRYATRIGFFL